MKLEIVFGVMAAPLAAQLDCRPKEVEASQKDADAICRLLVRGLLPESAGRAARKKLMKRLLTFKASAVRHPQETPE